MSRLVPFLLIAFSAAVFFLYVRPTYSGSITHTREQIKSYDDALAAADRFQEREAELSAARAQIPADKLSRLNSFLPDGVDNVQLILDMDALAARSGLTLSEFNTQTESASPSSASGSNGAQVLGLTSTSPVDSVNLTFKATGTYGSFRTFLTGLEGSLRPLDVVNVDISESATGVYTYGMTVRIYWLR